MTQVSPTLKSPAYARLFATLLGAYAFGCGTSMSVMSSAAFLLCLMLVVELAVAFFERLPSPRRHCTALSVGLAAVAYPFLGLAFRGAASELRSVAGYLLAAALFLYPLSPLRPRVSAPALRRMVWAAAIGSLVAVATAFWQRFANGQVRVDGFMKNAVIFAYGLLPPLVFFAFSVRKAWAAALAAAIYAAILLSGTRMAILVGAVALAAAWLPGLLKPGRGRLFAALFLLAAVGTAGWQLSRGGELADRLSRLSSRDPAVWGRWEIWKINLAMFADSPAFGTGFHRNLIEVDRHPQLTGVLPPGSRGIFAHSIYVQSLAEGGLVGFALFFGFQALFFAVFPAARPLLLATWAAGLSDTPFSVPRMYYPFFAFLLLSVLAGERRDAGAEKA